jgi:membrane protein implicated in regulation of membrane protease activity
MLESITNVAVGFVITLVCSPFIYTLCGMEYTWGQLGWVTVIFTALSIVRSYIIRRFFNKKTIKEVNQEVLL